jgi:hypothetical protein
MVGFARSAVTAAPGLNRKKGMEYWSVRKTFEFDDFLKSITPPLQYSNTPRHSGQNRRTVTIISGHVLRNQL